MNVHKLIVLRGNSGSGKTTIAKELQKRFGNNAMLISQDVIRRDMLNVKDGENTLALPLMKELLVYGHGHSYTVILEEIMITKTKQELESVKEIDIDIPEIIQENDNNKFKYRSVNDEAYLQNLMDKLKNEIKNYSIGQHQGKCTSPTYHHA